MEFWMFFFVIVIVLFCLNNYLPNPYDKYMVYFFVFILWFIGGFRYNIGTDYCLYAQWYEDFSNIDLMDNDVNREIGFLILIKILNMFGFDSQVMFLFFETIIILFAYKGFKFYLNDYNSVMLALCLYTTLKLQASYLGSLNMMRQSMAISIVFYASQYILIGKYFKYAIYLLIAMLFHKSIIIMLCLIPISRYLKISQKSSIIIICVSVIALAFNVGGLIFEKLISLTTNMEMYEGYGEVLANFSIATERSIHFVEYMIFLLFILLFNAYYSVDRHLKSEIQFVYLMSLTYVCLRIVTCFSTTTSNIVADVLGTLIHRVDSCFLLFFYCGAAYALKNNILAGKNKIVFSIFVFLLCAIMSMKMMYGDYEYAKSSPITLPSMGNYNYEFNFKLIK